MLDARLAGCRSSEALCRVCVHGPALDNDCGTSCRAALHDLPSERRQHPIGSRTPCDMRSANRGRLRLTPTRELRLRSRMGRARSGYGLGLVGTWAVALDVDSTTQ